MKVTAYKSPYTGELFESEEEFKKHMQLQKEHDRLEELKKERDQYVIEVKKRKEKACAEDIMITKLNNKHFYVSNQIDVLRAELIRIQNQLGIYEKEHEDSIVKENPFKAYEEYIELYAKFKTN